MVDNIRDRDFYREGPLVAAAARGYIDSIKKLRRDLTRWDKRACEAAAYYGHLDTLKYLHKEKCPWDETTWHAALSQPSQRPSLDNIEGAAAQLMAQMEMLEYLADNECPCSEEAFMVALDQRPCFLDILELLCSLRCPYTEFVTNAAIWNNQLEALEFLHRKGCPLSVDCGRLAASKGHVEIMVFLREADIQWDQAVYEEAVAMNQQAVVELLVEHQFPVDCETPARLHNLGILTYVHERCGTPFGPDIVTSATLGRSAGAEVVAGQSPALDIIKYLHEKGCSWSVSAMNNAVRNNSLETVQYLHQNGCPWDEGTTQIAETYNNAPILKYLSSNKCPGSKPIVNLPDEIFSHICMYLGPETITIAVQEKDFNMVKWLRVHGAPWNEMTCVAAATTGQHDVLTYLLDNGCPSEEEACVAAINRHDLAALTLLHEHMCPSSVTSFVAAVMAQDVPIVRYLRANNCQWKLPAFIGELFRFGNMDVIEAMDLAGALNPHDVVWNRYVMSEAAKLCPLDMIIYLERQGYPLHSNLYEEAASLGKTDIVQHLLDSDITTCVNTLIEHHAAYGYVSIIADADRRGFQFTARCYGTCILLGYIDVVKYLDEHNHPRSDIALAMAARYGRLELVKYFHSRGDRLTMQAFEMAAQRGSLEVVKYLRKNRCPWNRRVMAHAAAHGHIKVLHYLHDEKCPRNDAECMSVAKTSRIRAFLRSTQQR